MIHVVNCGLLIYCPHWSVSGQRGRGRGIADRNVEVFHFAYLHDTDADKFQTSTHSSLSTDTSAVKFS